MSAVWAAASYSRGVFNLCCADSATHVMVPGGSKLHLEPGTIHPCWNLLLPDVVDTCGKYRKLQYFHFMIEEGGGVMFSAVTPPV